MKQIPILFSHQDLYELYPTESSFSSFVFRALKQGKIKQIKKGLYALIDPSTAQIYASPFQIASRLSQNSYFSYHEALEYYGLANQSFVSSFIYLSHGYNRGVDFNGVSYKSKKSFCEIQIVNHMAEEGIRTVSLERAIIDSIDCPTLGGGVEEIDYALENSPQLDLFLIEELLDFYGKKVLFQKTGYLFEKHFGNSIPESFYDKCLNNIGKRTVYFDSRVGNAKLNAKWNLMVEDERKYPNELF